MRTALPTITRRRLRTPLHTGTALAALAGMPPTLVLGAAAIMRGRAAYLVASLVCIALFAVAGVTSGVVFCRVQRSRRAIPGTTVWEPWVAAAGSVLAILILGGGSLLWVADLGATEAGLARLALGLPSLALLGISSGITLALLAGRSRSRARENAAIAAAGVLLVLLGSTHLGRDALIDGTADPEKLEKLLPRLAEDARLRPNTAAAQRAFGFALLRVDRPAEALPVLEKADRMDRGHHETERAIGEALVRQDRHAEALPWLRRAVRGRPQDSRAWWQLGVALGATYRHFDADRAFREAIRLGPDDSALRMDYAWLLVHWRRNADALAQVERSMALDTTDAAAHRLAAELAIALARYDDGRLHAEHAVRLAPDDADAWSWLGVAHSLAGRMDEADDAFAEAARLRPGYFDRRPREREMWANARVTREGQGREPGAAGIRR